ncbi:MAG: carboxypeptidase regulatory-like domain-containing protein, partial [Natronosporangium sp.]
VETGRSYQGRAGDGTFLVPLPPGTWHLAVSSFGHVPATVEVTVAASESLALPVTLTPVPTGTVSGTVTGPDGSPVAGAAVGLPGTPLTATTGPDGGYTVDLVPGGDWTLRVTADGFRAGQLPVTVAPGQDTPVDVRLSASVRVAFTDASGTSTHGTALARLIADEGYQVEVFDRNDMAALAGRIDEFALVVFDSVVSTAAQRDGFLLAVQAAEQAGVSTIYGGQRGTWPLNQLITLRGDPAETIVDNTTVGLDYLPSAAHPIFAGFPVGEPIPIVDSTSVSGNQRLSAFAGYSGTSIADVLGRTDGEDFGSAVGYRFTSPTSVEILLASLAASGTDGFPGDGWTGQAERIYLNAVGWAVDATQAELAGVVTGNGGPLAGARVTAVESGASTTTGPDGSYRLGLGQGTQTIQASAFGFAPATREVEVPESGTVTLDVDLVPLPRGSLTGTVSSAAGGPIAGASVVGTGPLDWTASTGADGRYTAGGLLEGEYQVSIAADGFLPAAAVVTITAGEPIALDVTLQPTDVGVLGDVDGRLTGYLQSAGVPADELAWNPEMDLTGYRVVVVNGGSPDAATFAAVLAAADAAQVSLVFTGTWAVDRGGIRLLEQYTDRVVVGAQGFGDGPVQLTSFDPAHPLFGGLAGDPATLIAAGGYYSVLDRYAGQPLADLRVSRDGGAGPVTGLAAGWDWRTAGSIELVLSASAVTEAVGPGRGWTPEGGQLVVDAIAWARDRVLAAPAAPTIAPDAPVVLGETVTVTGQADWPSQVTVSRDGAPVATVDTGLDGSWSADVPLAVGENQLTAAASNLAGGSPDSAPVTVSRWVAQWEARGQWPVHVVTLDLDGPSRWTDPAEKAELVVLDADGNEVRREQLQWVNGFYLHVLRGLRPGEYTLQAELVVDGHLLVIDGPEIS